jgi:hypothetical protein
MPEVSRFFGIRIVFFYNDHAPPHFHALYEGCKAAFDIHSLQMTDGVLPPRVRGLVVEWAAQHQSELEMAWNTVRRGQPPAKIAPLE